MVESFHCISCLKINEKPNGRVSSLFILLKNKRETQWYESFHCLSCLKINFALDSLLEFEFKVSCLTADSSSNKKVIYRRFLRLQFRHPFSMTFSERLLFSCRRVTRGGRGGRCPLPFFKNWKKVP